MAGRTGLPSTRAISTPAMKVLANYEAAPVASIFAEPEADPEPESEEIDEPAQEEPVDHAGRVQGSDRGLFRRASRK